MIESYQKVALGYLMRRLIHVLLHALHIERHYLRHSTIGLHKSNLETGIHRSDAKSEL